MAATVLNSQRAIEMSVFVVRTFVKLREVQPVAPVRRRIGFDPKETPRLKALKAKPATA